MAGCEGNWLVFHMLVHCQRVFICSVFVLCLGGHFAGLQSHLEAFFALQDDVRLQLEVFFLQVGVHAIVTQHGREQNLQLQHGVLAT